MPPLPSIDNFTSISCKCTQDKPLAYVLNLYIYICKHGLKLHKLLGNLIVSMFVEAECLYDSQDAFDMRGYKCEHLWNLLIPGCIKRGDSRRALNMYKQVHKDFVRLDVATYLALLKACVDLKDMEAGSQIHRKISEDRLLQCDTFIGNKLVDFYAKCGSISKAQDVFEKIAARDVVSWNALLIGYVKNNYRKEAIDCFEKMQLAGVSPNAITLGHCLKACVITEDSHKGRQVHLEIARKGFFDHFIGNALVDMYAKLGPLKDAQYVFDNLVSRDVVSWTALIAGYIKQERCKEALNCFEQMKHQGVKPNAFTFVCALKACGNVGNLVKGAELHDGVINEGFLQSNLLVGNALIDMYAKCGVPGKALHVFDELPVQDVVSWNALIGGYLKVECYEEALSCFREMQAKGVSPDAITFVCGLKASGNLGEVGVGQEIYVEVLRKGLLEKDDVLGNTLVDMYAKCGLLAKAKEVFDLLPNRTIVSWTSLIAEYANRELAEDALDCLEQMQHEGFGPNAVTFACSLKACGIIMDIEKGRWLHAEIERKGFLEGDLDIGNGLTAMYAKCGFLADAQEMFDKLPTHDIISWNALIVGYSTQKECGAAVLKCFDNIQLDGISPNAATLAYSLKACGSVEDQDKAKSIHALIVQKGLLESDLCIGTSVMEMYTRFGMVEEAQQVFGMISVRDDALWTSLIAGYINNEYVNKALMCFEQMQEEGIAPTAATFMCILKACGSAGKLDEGRDIHAEIARNGWMEKDPALGNALVDMYAKFGLLANAQEVVHMLPVRDVFTWNALIGGYAKHELNQEALDCFEQMQEEGVQPNAVTFVCCLNAFASLEFTGKSMDLFSEIARKGLLDTDLVVGSALVNAYAQRGLLAKACEVFNRLPIQDVTSWTALIGGYANFKHGERALMCYTQMQLEGVFPNAATFICILKACGSIAASEKGREIHAKISFEGTLMQDLGVGNALVDMYAKSGFLSTALVVLNKLPLRDTLSWNPLISEYSTHGLSEEVLTCYDQMQLEGVLPSAVTFACSLEACGCLGAADKGQDIHAEISKKRLLETDPMVGNALVSMYMRFGLLAKAQEVFDRLLVQNTASWIELITGCAANESEEEAIHLFEQMVLKVIEPDPKPVCSSSNAVQTSDDYKRVHECISARQLSNRSLVVGSALIDTYAKCGSLGRAKKVFDNLAARDVVLWTALMVGYAKHELNEEALNSYDQMLLEGISPDSAALVCGLKACGSLGALEKGAEIHAEISRKGLLEKDLVVGNALVDMYSKCGASVKAQEVFDELPVVDIVTWTTLITGYAESGDGDRVFSLFEAMRRDIKKPDVVAFLKVLDACSRADVLEKALLYMDIMQKEYGMSPSLEHHNCLVDLVGRAGDLEKAQAIIKEMPFHPDLVVWHTIMGACKKWGYADLGKRAFEHVLPCDG